MSEKRFKVCIDSNNGVGLFDNSIRLLFIKFTNKEDAVSCRNALMCHCDLLNEMSDENGHLKKENEQLKQENNKFDKDNLDLILTNFKQIKERLKLMNENKQLKEELQRFKKYVFTQDNILCYKCEHCIKKDIYVVDCEMKGGVDVHGLCSLFRKVKV